MLRDFEYNSDTSEIIEAISRFEVDPVPTLLDLEGFEFEALSPDSFMWKLLINNETFYMYAEDYVPSLEHIRAVYDDYHEGVSWEFVLPREKISFEKASPVTGAEVYQKPVKADELMQYAIDSGHDFVFLARVATAK